MSSCLEHLIAYDGKQGKSAFGLSQVSQLLSHDSPEISRIFCEYPQQIREYMNGDSTALTLAILQFWNLLSLGIWQSSNESVFQRQYLLWHTLLVQGWAQGYFGSFRFITCTFNLYYNNPLMQCKCLVVFCPALNLTRYNYSAFKPFLQLMQQPQPAHFLP